MARRKRTRSTSPSNIIHNVCTKELAFAERYDTANNTKEQVLSKSSFYIFFLVLQGLMTLRRLGQLTRKFAYLELQMKNWSSTCYDHFKTPTIIEEKGEIKYQFSCQTYVFFFLP